MSKSITLKGLKNTNNLDFGNKCQLSGVGEAYRAPTIPMGSMVTGSLVDALNRIKTNQNCGLTIFFDEESKAEEYENFLDKKNAMYALQVQTKLIYDAEFQHYYLKPEKAELVRLISGENEPTASSVKLTIGDSVSPWVKTLKSTSNPSPTKFIPSSLLRDNVYSQYSNANFTSYIQFFNQGQVIYYLHNTLGNISHKPKHRNGNDDFFTKISQDSGVIDRNIAAFAYDYIGERNGYGIWEVRNIANNSRFVKNYGVLYDRTILSYYPKFLMLSVKNDNLTIQRSNLVESYVKPSRLYTRETLYGGNISAGELNFDKTMKR